MYGTETHRDNRRSQAASSGIGLATANGSHLRFVDLDRDVTPSRSILMNSINIASRCFGASKTSFTVPGTCTSRSVANGASGDIGNAAWTSISTSSAAATINPFNVYISARIKL